MNNKLLNKNPENDVLKAISKALVHLILSNPDRYLIRENSSLLTTISFAGVLQFKGWTIRTQIAY